MSHRPYIRKEIRGTLTVAELIFHLLDFPPDYEVKLAGTDGPTSRGIVVYAPAQIWCNASQVIIHGRRPT